MRRVILSAVLMFGAVAQAKTYNLGQLEPNKVYAIAESGLSGSFSDLVNFTVKNHLSVTYAFEAFNILPMKVTTAGFLFGGETPTESFYSITGQRTSELTGVGSLDLFGSGGATFVSGSQPTYVPGNYYLEITAAVPEPGTWLTMLAGAGLIAWRMRQRLHA